MITFKHQTTSILFTDKCGLNRSDGAASTAADND